MLGSGLGQHGHEGYHARPRLDRAKKRLLGGLSGYGPSGHLYPRHTVMPIPSAFCHRYSATSSPLAVPHRLIPLLHLFGYQVTAISADEVRLRQLVRYLGTTLQGVAFWFLAALCRLTASMSLEQGEIKLDIPGVASTSSVRLDASHCNGHWGIG